MPPTQGRRGRIVRGARPMPPRNREPGRGPDMDLETLVLPDCCRQGPRSCRLRGQRCEGHDRLRRRQRLRLVRAGRDIGSARAGRLKPPRCTSLPGCCRQGPRSCRLRGQRCDGRDRLRRRQRRRLVLAGRGTGSARAAAGRLKPPCCTSLPGCCRQGPRSCRLRGRPNSLPGCCTSLKTNIICSVFIGLAVMDPLSFSRRSEFTAPVCCSYLVVTFFQRTRAFVRGGLTEIGY